MLGKVINIQKKTLLYHSRSFKNGVGFGFQLKKKSALEFSSTRIWEKDYGPFRAFGYVAPEDIDVEDIFDDDASKLNMFHLKEDIAYGKKIWVQAQVKVYCKGIELGDASMGGLLYKDYDGLKKEIFDVVVTV